MLIQDRLYGPVTITEPVLLDLLNTWALQRLDGVLQHGVSAQVGVTSRTSRREHSIGAMLLVRRLGADLPEQIAALLHDVSHTAMSHVIDYLFARHNSQSYHDERKEWFVAQSDIPTVLIRYGYDWRALLHEEDFSLLEQPSPALCADRLDYFLRDGYDLGIVDQAAIAYVLHHLTVLDGRMVLDDVEAARQLAYGFLAADDASWSNFREVGLYELTAQALRLALAKGLITETDLWGTDDALWRALYQSPNPELHYYLRFVDKRTAFVRDATAPTFTVTTKIRTLDPDVYYQGNVMRFSAIEPAFAAYREAYLAQKQGAWPIRVVGFQPSVVTGTAA
ncbi:MAG: HD domain-containing protein [Caldilinea sp. CFX5]|nr:HD domain-containing protein [Caldilinea sp. CFX5]